MDESRPWVTCHVLDTVAGKPGANISVHLWLYGRENKAMYFTAKTNADGRVTDWIEVDTKDPRSLNEWVKILQDEAHDSLRFKMTFFTEEYFGKGKTFFPFVDINFEARCSEAHYHVPLLLGPWSYTTYRGS
ncbi:hypothetical protein MBLNU457_1563t1 [Dothideomycetes sp. NU457]